MVALFLFLLARPLPTMPLINLMAIVSLWLSAGLSVWTAWAYIKGK
jgi:phosphatidylglycerophosphate synthase